MPLGRVQVRPLLDQFPELSGAALQGGERLGLNHHPCRQRPQPLAWTTGTATHLLQRVRQVPPRERETQGRSSLHATRSPCSREALSLPAKKNCLRLPPLCRFRLPGGGGGGGGDPRLLPLLVLLTCDHSNQLIAQWAERNPPQVTSNNPVLPPVRTGRAVAEPISSLGGEFRGGRKQKKRTPNQILEPWSDGSRGPWASERGAQGACPSGPIRASPPCGASASNARVSQLIVSSRELFSAATERSRSRRSRDPPGGGERRRGWGSRGCSARGSGFCHGASWG